MQLREYLAKYKVKHNTFGKILGVHPTHFSQVLCGKRNPGKTLINLILLLTKGKVSVNEIQDIQDQSHVD